jgi:alkanesulfonate monooxygenase SsuD/methylene tetrahydromethanopterin reductase-like flavin-dependent oxidoreductase (luciferase family)
MKFGIFNLMTLRDNPGGVAGILEDTRTMISLAESIGFDIAWFAEHHFTNYSISVSPVLTAAHFVGYTKRIRLGLGVVVLPLYHPFRMAQEIAILDQMSAGRVVLGVGTGYQKYEFARYGSPINEKNEVFLEYWNVLEQALTQGRAALQGKHISVPETVFAVRPVQKPLPEIYITAIEPTILKRLAVHNAIPFVTAGGRGTPALFDLADKVAQTWRAAGLSQTPMRFALQQYIHVTDSKKEALEAAERARYIARMVGALRNADVITLDGPFIQAPPLPDEPSLEQYRDNLIIGDAHHVAERVVQEIRRLDPIHYNCFFQFGDMPIVRARRSLERFGAEVLPLVEKEVGPLDAIGQSARPLEVA